MLARSTSQPSSLTNSPPPSPRAERPAAATAIGSPAAAAPAAGGGGGLAAKETVAFDGGLTLPAALYDRLFAYQQVGVQWMWELHMQRTGGTTQSPPPTCVFLLLHLPFAPPTTSSDGFHMQWLYSIVCCLK